MAAYKWKEFVSAGTAFRTEDEAPTNHNDWGCSLQWHTNRPQATSFFTGLLTGLPSSSLCSSTYNNPHNIVETLSIDEDSDSEIQVVETKSKKKPDNKREDELHVLFHKKNSQMNDEDEIQIIEDEDCSIVSCSRDISKNIKKLPTEVPKITCPIPQHHWCIICRGYFFESKETHERSIAHKVNMNDASPAPQVPASFNYRIPTNNKGYQMLLAQGWDQSKGLGKDGKGLKTPVKTILKLDRSGLGNNPEPARVSHFAAGDSESVKASQERKKRKFTENWEMGNATTTRHNKMRCVTSHESFAEKQKEYEIRKEIYNF